MTQVKSYCLADAAAMFALTAPSATDAELKEFLIIGSDVPADRIDACFAELQAGDMFNAARGMAMLYQMAQGHRPHAGQIRACFESVIWNDDGERHTTIKTKIVDEDGNAEAKIEITKRY